MGCTIMVRNTCEKRKRDFEIKTLKDAHPIGAEFHYLGNCIQGRLVVYGFGLFYFQCKYSQEEADLTEHRPE